MNATLRIVSRNVQASLGSDDSTRRMTHKQRIFVIGNLRGYELFGTPRRSERVAVARRLKPWGASILACYATRPFRHPELARLPTPQSVVLDGDRPHIERGPTHPSIL